MDRLLIWLVENERKKLCLSKKIHKEAQEHIKFVRKRMLDKMNNKKHS